MSHTLRVGLGARAVFQPSYKSNHLRVDEKKGQCIVPTKDRTKGLTKHLYVYYEMPFSGCFC